MSDQAQPAFDTLIYTDCLQGQGLRGTVGLQFQARSSGADEAAMSVVQQNLLYEPPSKWMRERRPVDRYPSSLAHVHNGHYATAAGVYLGREATGSREGNQLTHSVVTLDPAAYVRPVRPAMLFGAQFWTKAPAPTTSCPPLAPGWEPGPFDAVSAKAFITAQPDGAGTLVALLSALQLIGTPEARRVLFIAEDPAPVLHWLTAATLLLPHEQALDIGFKVFTTNPDYASQPVLAVHPDWESTTARVDNDGGYAVFDLVSGRHSPVEATDSARRRVAMFCKLDPWDAVDIVELGAASGLAGEDDELLGRTVILGEPLTDRAAEVLVEWLRDTQADLLKEERGRVVDALASDVERWSPKILLALDEVSRSGQVPADRMAPVRLALIRAEVRRAMRDGEVGPQLLPPLPAGIWRDQHQRAAEGVVVDALQRARPEGFDAVLRVAARFSLAVRVGDIRDAAYGFVLYWAAHPRDGFDPTAWPSSENFEYLLADELIRQIEEDPSRAPAIGDGWWEARLPRTSQPTTALDQAVISAAVLHGGADLRHRWVKRLLGLLHTDDRYTRLVVQVLWSRSQPTYEELRLLHPLVPPGTALPPELFQRLTRNLHETPGAETIALVRSYVDIGALQPDRDARKVLDGDQLLNDLLRDLRRVDVKRLTKSTVAATVAAIPDALLLQRRHDLEAALLRVNAPRLVLAVVRALPMSMMASYLRELIRALDELTALDTARTAYYLSRLPDLPDLYYRELEDALIRWINRIPGKRLEEASEYIAELGPNYAKAWRALVDNHRAGTILGRTLRRKGK
jgi:hypothetical protein